jgi:CheY-like chemotaxis protein/anti-sigma regulatory factor (Ser/Thr protein kinase)
MRAKGRADDANAAKSAFLANMSHELRTPMNGVLGLTEIMLLDEALTEQQRERLGTIYDSGRALVDLLNDILDLSRVEAGRFVLEEIPWDPAAVLRDVERLCGEVARREGLDFHVELDPAMPRSVQGDPTRVRQVLCNLVGNAMKFTERGSVTLGSQWSDDRLVLFVRDTGPGISASIRQAIFEPFTQEDSSTARRYGGSGLGLAISRNLTLLMGGKLELQSEVGVGSCLRMTLPVTVVEPAGPSRSSRPLLDEVTSVPELAAGGTTPEDRAAVDSPSGHHDHIAGATILLVEDVPVNRLVVSLMLKDFGCRVEEAIDGEQALEKMLSGEPYAAVLMDWHLPKMDGVEVTKRARHQGYTSPIIALTASVRAEDRDSVLSAGMDTFLGKPFTREELRHALGTVLA